MRESRERSRVTMTEKKIERFREGKRGIGREGGRWREQEAAAKKELEKESFREGERKPRINR